MRVCEKWVAYVEVRLLSIFLNRRFVSELLTYQVEKIKIENVSFFCQHFLTIFSESLRIQRDNLFVLFECCEVWYCSTENNVWDI